MLLTWDCNPPLHLLLPFPGDIWPFRLLLHVLHLLFLLVSAPLMGCVDAVVSVCW